MNFPLAFGLLLSVSVITANVYADTGYAVAEQKKERQMKQSIDKTEKLSTPIYSPGSDKNDQLSKETKQTYQKKPLSKDEKEALRRQVNEAERMYEKK